MSSCAELGHRPHLPAREAEVQAVEVASRLAERGASVAKRKKGDCYLGSDCLL